MNSNKHDMKWGSGLFSAGAALQWLLYGCLMLLISRAAMAEHGPVEMLQLMTTTLENVVKNDPNIIYDENRLRTIAHEVVLPHVDIRTMSRWVLGKNWRKASPEQRENFVVEFRDLLLSTYLRQVKTYNGESARFLPLRGEQREGQAVVNAEIVQPNGPLIHATFRLHQPQGEWMIFDVSVEGISLVATHRSGFNTEIRNRGIDELIARLHRLNESNLDGSSSVVTKEKAG